mmetsp:Transcript_7953/g.26649  ORF Transcript_7953/g.26649 Transcript_7953/m.26649 type:complete len:86 (-) Transcript_7953:148-405(-)
MTFLLLPRSISIHGPSHGIDAVFVPRVLLGLLNTCPSSPGRPRTSNMSGPSSAALISVDRVAVLVAVGHSLMNHRRGSLFQHVAF